MKPRFLLTLFVVLVSLAGYGSARTSQAESRAPQPPGEVNVQVFLPLVIQRSSLPEPGSTLAIGLMGIPSDQLGLTMEWGGNTLETYDDNGMPDTQTLFDMIKALGGRLIVTAKVDYIGEDGSFDHAALTDGLHDTFDGTTLPGDPAFFAYAMLDEPCHPAKWPDLTGADLAALYQTVKAYDSRLAVLHNFGYLDCVETRLNESGGLPIADVAAFTITYGKTMYDNNIDGFLAEQAAIAVALKAAAPELVILPWIAISETDIQPFPSESWVETVGLAVIAEPNYSGAMYYPWVTPFWAMRSLDDIRIYDDEIQRVFEAAD